jgi:glycosyltransferase involved in cell wall biosynthesis
VASVAPDMAALATLHPRITILLSTFNGENYLKTQLDSIEQQSYENWAIAWRDDGSVDNTTTIMEEFEQHVGEDRCKKSASSGSHLGAAVSFLQLLSENTDSPYVAFADQDDLWMPSKLQRSVDHLGIPGNMPALYCSRQLLTDDYLGSPTLSMKYQGTPGFPASLTQNIATGNTLVMNSVAARLVSSIPIPEASLHDWWSYIVISACGGTIIYDPEPTMYYRQHTTNMVGSQLMVLSRAIGALERGPGTYMTMMRRHADRLHEHRDKLTPEAAADLDLIRKGLAGRLKERMAALRCKRFTRATLLETFLLRVWFLTG